MDSFTRFMVGTRARAFGTVLFSVLVVVQGLVISYLWKWFIVPLGVKSISIAWAIGISMIVNYLTHTDSNVDKSKDVLVALMSAILGGLLVLLFGYIVHACM